MLRGSDLALVREQLGRTPLSEFSVVARCGDGHPLVIRNHPIDLRGRPFPTLFWLTCPVLVKRASRLEAGGHMTELNERLGRNEAVRARLDAALGRYRARRDSREVIEDSGAPPGGGPDRIKCLHAHLAHHLSGGGNAIGAEVAAMIGPLACRRPCVVQP